jgi:hypothetical protein
MLADPDAVTVSVPNSEAVTGADTGVHWKPNAKARSPVAR